MLDCVKPPTAQELCQHVLQERLLFLLGDNCLSQQKLLAFYSASVTDL